MDFKVVCEVVFCSYISYIGHLFESNGILYKYKEGEQEGDTKSIEILDLISSIRRVLERYF